jgi:hypothetical protein
MHEFILPRLLFAYFGFGRIRDRIGQWRKTSAADGRV